MFAAVANPRVEVVEGDPAIPGRWQRLIGSCDAVVHLAGEPIAARRWNAEVREAIRRSRVEGTYQVAFACSSAAKSPAVLLSASGIGFLPRDRSGPLDESAPPGRDFLAQVAVAWEREATRARSASTRVVALRIPIVLDADSGFLREVLPWWKRGIDPTPWSAHDRVPWLHWQDLLEIVDRALLDDRLEGPVHAVAPEVSEAAVWRRAMASAVGRGAVRVPPMLARLAAGGVIDSMRGSCEAVAAKLEAIGFAWRHRDLHEAIAAELALREESTPKPVPSARSASSPGASASSATVTAMPLQDRAFEPRPASAQQVVKLASSPPSPPSGSEQSPRTSPVPPASSTPREQAVPWAPTEAATSVPSLARSIEAKKASEANEATDAGEAREANEVISVGEAREAAKSKDARETSKENDAPKAAAARHAGEIVEVPANPAPAGAGRDVSEKPRIAAATVRATSVAAVVGSVAAIAVEDPRELESMARRVQAWRSLGIETVLASRGGRLSIEPMLDRLGFAGPLILDLGASLRSGPERRLLRATPLAPDLAMAIFERLVATGSVHPTLHDADGPIDPRRIRQSTPVRIDLSGDATSLDRAIAAISDPWWREGAIAVFRIAFGQASIVAGGVDKAVGLQRILRGLGLPPSRAFVIAGGEEDLGLLSLCRGIALGAPSPRLASAATSVIPSGDWDAVDGAVRRAFAAFLPDATPPVHSPASGTAS